MNAQLKKQLIAVRKASYEVLTLSVKEKNAILKTLAELLRKNSSLILRANKKDFANLPDGYAMKDRLLLTSERVEYMAKSLLAVIKLKDPIGEVLSTHKQAHGITVQQVRVPIGVLGVIYEARPNVTVEIVSLCIKTGNAVVLKGSRSAHHTNLVLVKLIRQALKKHSIDPRCVQLIDPFNRKLTEQLMQAEEYVDILIPRGSDRLIQFVRKHASIPTIETGAGVCHTYVERSADITKAAAIIVNAKTRRPTVCNTLDTLVVDEVIVRQLAKAMASNLAKHNVTIYADTKSYAALKKIYPERLLKKATTRHYGKEFLSYTMSIKTVKQFDAGLRFVQEHTSGHSEAIITKNTKRAKQFMQQIDAAAVYTNTSTAFTDGFEYGLGAEIGISTQKMHARGPMGLTALTTYKWMVTSAGATRDS